MATSNFYNKHSKFVHIAPEDADQFFNLYKYEVEKSLIDKGWEENIGHDKSYGRDYYSIQLKCDLYKPFVALGHTYSVELIPVIRCGYYQGCNIDYDYEIIIDGYDTDCEDDVISLCIDIMPDEVTYISSEILDTLQAFKNKFEQDIDECANTKRHLTVGPFGNGECMYRNVEHLLNKAVI